MPYACYPNFTDLTRYLAATGLDLPGGIDTESKVAAAIAEWETRTGWMPFVAAKDGQGNPLTSVRLFDPPGSQAGRGPLAGSRGGRFLALDSGLLSLTGVTITETPYTQGLDFWLRPNNALARSLPYTEIEFLSPVFGLPQSIAVTGVWGKTLTLAGDVWQAILQYAAFLCVPEMALSISGGLVKIEDVQYAVGNGAMPLAVLGMQWETAFEKAVKRQKRIVL